ncbi:MAG TPA: RodZ domain-containing protein [Vicinamibacterales bacterium]|nr:RodZ domain-containing protein [Vicinamibacterales bacterium]
MSDSNELKKSNTPAGTPVPDLIEQYRVRRDAWIAQADELGRLRDEVRGSAEREAMEIVTAARRDVRQIVMEARRELLVLSAQVQAALGEAGARPDATGLLKEGSDTDGGIEKPDFEEAIFAHEEAVKGMLDEARADMDALTEDARTVPFQALSEPAKLPPPPELPSVFSEATLLSAQHPLPSSPAASSHTLSHTPSMSSTSSHAPSMSTAASRTLLASPFSIDSVPVPSTRRARIVIGLFGVAGIAVLVGTIMWLRSGKEPAAVQTAAPATGPVSAPSTPAPVSTTPSLTPTTPPPPVATTPERPSALSLLVEARRSSWLRTTVDGESDSGRMLAQGETVRLNAQQSVSLRVGDAGAVFVSVNTGKATPLGRDGQVVTRQFVVENTDRQGASRAASTPQVSPANVQAETAQIAAAPPNPTTPSAPPASAPLGASNPVPLVQPVAATPSRQPVATPSNPSLDPGPPAARAEATVPPVAPRAELPTPGPASPASAVVTASRQWLDAYHRQDRATMASLQTERLQITDERRNEERFPSNVNVNRTLDRVSVQIAADTAVLTAVMTERSSDNIVPPRVSPVSQVWEFRGNQWRVSQVRLVSEARLNQVFR